MSRINFSFNIQVQRFTRLHGITNKCVWFSKSSGGKGAECFQTKMPVLFLWRARGLGGLCQGEETCIRLYFKILSDGFVWWGCTAFPSPGSLDAVAWSAFEESFAGTAWGVTLQSCCKITVTDMGSFTAPQKQPALLGLYIAKPGSGGEPIRIPPVCLGQQCQWALSGPRGCSSGAPTPQGQLSITSSAALLMQGAPWDMCLREEQALNTVSHACVWAERTKS